MTEVPTTWRSALPALGYALPDDRSPASTDRRAVTVNVPLRLIRQAITPTEYWDIPAPVLEQYRRYRPTPLWRATGWEKALGSPVPIYVKYEGANISGSHKLNTALAQAHYYKETGVREVVTGTGAGQWGTALAAACATFGLRTTVFMVGTSLADKPYRGTLMRTLGATVHASPSPLTAIGRSAAGAAPTSNSLALAIGEAVEYAADRDLCAFATGSGETYSLLHQSVIGLESAEQLAALGAEVDVVVGSVGAGSNFGGIALPFFADAHARGAASPLLLAAESSATPKLTRGVYAYDHTDASGSGPMEAMYTVGAGCAIPPSHAAGLRYHGVAKLLSAMRDRDQIAATAIGQATALAEARRFTLAEATLPAPESGHALAAAAQVATVGVSDRGREHQARSGVLVCVSGHGYLDLAAYDAHMSGALEDVDADDAAIRRAVAGLIPAGRL